MFWHSSSTMHYYDEGKLRKAQPFQHNPEWEKELHHRMPWGTKQKIWDDVSALTPPLPFTPKHQSTLLVIQGLQWVLGALWVLKHLVALVGIIIGDNFKKTWKEEPQIPKACTSFHVLLSLSMSESPSSNTGLLDTHILTEYIPVPWGTCQSSGRKKWWKEAGRMSVTSTFPFLKMQLWRKLKLDAWNSYIEWDTASAGPETIPGGRKPQGCCTGALWAVRKLMMNMKEMEFGQTQERLSGAKQSSLLVFTHCIGNNLI